ncbi:MAG: GNAT family N-acetyltransferase [Acidobacteria bacterium]|nr:GNAT family N-acetyltransferase [Acidobacteriota bacterium]
MTVTVRRARREDARAIAELAIDLVIQHQNYDARRFSRLASTEQAEWFYGNQTDAQDAAVLVAESDGAVVGFAYIGFEARNFAALLENAAWLHDIYVDQAARGKNAGRLLIEKAIEAAKELGADKLLLSVAAQNEFAREFFERQGFRPTMIEMMLDLS